MANPGNPHDPVHRSLTQAAAWRVRLAEAGLSSVPEFELWLRAPGNRQAWDKVSHAWTCLDEIAGTPDMQAVRRAALADARQAGEQARRAVPVRQVLGLVAAVLLVAVFGLGATWWLNRADDYRTAMGERRVITLSDGSKLSLDADSEVTVHYVKSARLLHLLRGQARFDVAHDKRRPFSVVAGNQKVIATGTAFNIDMGGPKVVVTLIEGHVVVLNEEGNGTEAAGRDHAWPRRVELRAGQQLAAGTAAAPQISQANIQQVNAWTIGQIAFDDEPLSSIVERVNRYGGTRIIIADPKVGAMKISGVLNAGDVPGFVEIVTHYLPVRAVSDGPNAIALQSEAKKGGTL